MKNRNKQASKWSNPRLKPSRLHIFHALHDGDVKNDEIYAKIMFLSMTSQEINKYSKSRFVTTFL